MCSLGVKRENIILCDTKGVVYKGRKEGMNKYKERFAQDTKLRTLAEAMVGADVFAGLSVKGAINQDMVRSMAPDPIVFAMANPDPEITYEEAKAARPDVIIATGRSDYPNQVNNVLGFPFIFRGALDVRATAINEEMKLAATHALADLAKEDVPDSVCRAYGVAAPAVWPRISHPQAVRSARADVGSLRRGRSRHAQRRRAGTGRSQHLSRSTRAPAGQGLRSLPHHDSQSAGQSQAGRISRRRQRKDPARLPCAGRRKNRHIPSCSAIPPRFRARAQELGVNLEGMQIVDPATSEHREAYVQELFRLRQRRGVTLQEAETLINDRNVFGSMMVHMGDADALVSGVTQHFPDTIRPALQIVRMREGLHRVSGCYAVITRKGEVFFLADCQRQHRAHRRRSG